MKELHARLLEWILLLAGTALMVLAYACFLIPAQIAPGGLTGVATVLHYVLDFPVGVTVIVLNIPLFLVGFRSVGHRFVTKSLVSMLLLSLLIDFLSLPILTHDPILAAIYGGALIGTGLGLVVRSGGSSGGTDMLANMIHRKRPHISMGLVLLIIDLVVVAMAWIAFDAERALYAIVTLFISSKLIDLIQEGGQRAKAFFIITQQAQVISRRILEELGRGITLLPGTGMYSGEGRDVLLCVTDRSEIVKIKQIIRQEDEHAFVIVADAREVMGEGFSGERISPNDGMRIGRKKHKKLE